MLRRKSLEEKLFEERFARLKLAFKCFSDGELAKKLGLKQQAVYAAKRRMKIPNTWLNTAIKKSISPSFIMDGKGSIHLSSYENELALTGKTINETPFYKKRHFLETLETIEAVSELKPALLPDGATLPDVELVAVQALLRLSLKSSGVRLTDKSKFLFTMHLKKHILPRIVVDISEEVIDFAEAIETLQSYNDSPPGEQQDDQDI
jgi:hypothetical protein